MTPSPDPAQVAASGAGHAGETTARLSGDVYRDCSTRQGRAVNTSPPGVRRVC